MKRIGTLFLITLAIVAMSQARAETAIFAGGCFWCVESDLQDVAGVVSVESGYTGGHLKNPSYKQVTAGGSGHYEAVRIEFNPSQLSYTDLLQLFITSIDPLDAGGQFCDRGDSYRSAIFVLTTEQQQQAERVIEQAQQQLQQRLGGKPKIVTPVLAATEFYPAEDYHQDYYLKNPKRYKYYRWSCGRDNRLETLWGEKPGAH